MGLFDMFGGGKDDEREKMRENIEQIREKVQSQERGRQPQQGAGGQPPGQGQSAGGQPPRQGDTGQMRQPPAREEGPARQGPAPQQGGGGQQPASAEGGPRGGQEGPTQPPRGADFAQPPAPEGGQPPAPAEEGRREQPPAQQERQPQEEFEWDDQEPRREDEQAGAREPVDAARSRLEEVESRTAELSVPSAPEVKELDIPNIEKGPLFITVSKFREALQTVSRLEAISQDLDTFAASLEDTLQEDRRMNEDIQKRLELAEENVEYIKDLVSPD